MCICDCKCLWDYYVDLQDPEAFKIIKSLKRRILWCLGLLSVNANWLQMDVMFRTFFIRKKAASLQVFQWCLTQWAGLYAALYSKRCCIVCGDCVHWHLRQWPQQCQLCTNRREQCWMTIWSVVTFWQLNCYKSFFFQKLII